MTKYFAVFLLVVLFVAVAVSSVEDTHEVDDEPKVPDGETGEIVRG